MWRNQVFQCHSLSTYNLYIVFFLKKKKTIDFKTLLEFNSYCNLFHPKSVFFLTKIQKLKVRCRKLFQQREVGGICE